MAEFPALPLWTDAYLGDTTHLTTIEHGAYLLLLMTAWRTADALHLYLLDRTSRRSCVRHRSPARTLSSSIRAGPSRPDRPISTSSRSRRLTARWHSD